MASSYKLLKSPRTVSIIAVGFSAGQSKCGADLGPMHLLNYGLIEQIKALDWKVTFDGNLTDYTKFKPTVDPDFGRLRQPLYVSRVSEQVAGVVEGFARRGEFALTLGGDHSIAMGTVSGTTRVYGEDLCVIWVDAHADINTPETTQSGNLHGCPVSFLLGLAKTEHFDWMEPILKKERLVYIGLRDVDEGEKRILREHKIKAFSMFEVDKYGIGKVVEMALDHVNPKRTLPIHLSFDVDALDPAVAPSTGTPVRGGLTFREGHYICEAIAETGLLVACDVVEINPLLGNQRSLIETVNIGCSLVRCCLGETLL